MDKPEKKKLIIAFGDRQNGVVLHAGVAEELDGHVEGLWLEEHWEFRAGDGTAIDVDVGFVG